MAKMSSTTVEIGNGEDGHYDWISEFSVLDEIKARLNELEYLRRVLEGSALTKILVELREKDSNIPQLDRLDDAFDLIKNHPEVSVDTEFFDSDMPVSSIWSKVTVDKSSMQDLIAVLNLAKAQIELYFEKERIPKLLEIKEKQRIKKEQKEKRIAKKKRTEQILLEDERRQVEEDEWVRSLVSKIILTMQKTRGLYCFEDFLLNMQTLEIFVLIRHTQYRKERQNAEVRVTNILKKEYQVYELEESSPPNSVNIPYFAGWKRFKVMGWKQTESILNHQDKDIEMQAVKLRETYISSLGTDASEK
ncbi:hypothetical protein N9C16_07080 [Paracoccaceae bacterium]|nr:hypothetical protein [Paracoccaceae bacterium]